MNFKKRANGSWIDISNYIHNTATDTITSLPVVLYPTGTTAAIGLKGNTVQNGTPTPAAPVIPEGCGDLETSGAKAGQYKIPISSASTTTPVYLGEVQSARNIKKVVFTGSADEAWNRAGSTHGYFTNLPSSAKLVGASGIISSHYQSSISGADGTIRVAQGRIEVLVYDNYTSVVDFKAYLQQQYANGTPVTIWYVLATEETGIVNKPLMKIGDYADEVPNVSIPVTAGGDTLSVDTTVQPSEITANYHGWHTTTAHERNNGQWD